MSDLPSISIVTPTLNQASYIKNTVDSVLNQDYPDFEYLVLDGGSVDSTREILDSYGEHLSWRIEPGMGQSRAINLGWQETGGEIIAWINSDDTYYPGTLQRVGDFFRRHPEVDMLYGDCDFVDADGQFLRSYPTRDFDYPALLRRTENFIPQPATFLRRRVLDRVGFLDETLVYVMDFDYWLRTGLSQCVVHLPEKLAALRLQPDAKSIAHLDLFAGELVRVYQKIFSQHRLPQEILDLKRDAMANIYFRAADCAFWGNDLPSARRYAQKSRVYRKWPLRRLWIWIALGRFGSRLVHKLFKNPYYP
jgi:glycosyltransferase involved in cell wall biosynthesis